MKRHAFTLIEVMVVLSILAIIAILAYNFFGSTSREANIKQRVTKIYNDMRVLDDAYRLYEQKKGTVPTSINQMVSEGIIKSAPVADPSALLSYIWDINDSNYSLPTNAMDDAIYGNVVNLDVCKAWNEKYCPGCTDGAGGNEFQQSLHGGAYAANVDIANNMACHTFDGSSVSGNIIWILDPQ